MPDNNIIEKDLGPVSAWAIAKANGFDGTEAEWEALQANAAQNGSDAEAFAKGTRNGETVASDDPAYHNNCAYHHAGTSADADTCTTKAAEATAAAATASAAYNVNLLAPNYSAESTYAVGDHVIYNGGYYECISAISTAEAWTAAHWRQLTVGGESADLKSALRFNNDFINEWEQGGLDSSGAEVPSSSSDYGIRIRTDFIDAGIGNRVLFTYIGNGIYINVFTYDENKNFIANTGWKDSNAEIEISTAYIRVVARYYNNAAIAPSVYSEINVSISQNKDTIARNEITELDDEFNYVIDADLYGKNVFNERAENAFTYGVALDSSGIPSITNPNFKITDFIPVNYLKGDKCTISWDDNNLPNIVRICAYYADKSFKDNAGTPTASTGHYTINLSSSIAYIRISIRKELNNIQVEYGTSATSYEPGYTANDNNARNEIENLENLVNKTIYKLEQSDWEQGGLDSSGAEVNSGIDYPLRIRTGYISIGKGSIIDYTPSSETYYMAVCYYDDNHNFISRTAWTYTTQRFESISSVVRIVARFINNTQISPADYEFFPVTLMYNLFTKSSSNWEGVKWVSYGDSITEMGLWQPYVISRFGLIHTNKGIGGTRVAERGSASSDVNTNWFGADDRINSIPLDTQLITIMGGTNDFGTPPSELVAPTWDSENQRFGTYGFQNGLCETIRKIYARIPGVQIVLMSLTGGQYTDNTYDMPQRKNSLGYTGYDYAKATEEVANLLNLPYIPIWNDGINVFNRTLYISDTVHPNDAGAKLIARMVIGWLLTNEPVD